ncbi:hypothetical protein ACFFWB_27040 [Flavobacterium procerum]|uniref:hypothetical protein n=1 Tax=Flavobacterium procerum TaxID=1455569 RepID=UPI0035EF3A3C
MLAGKDFYVWGYGDFGKRGTAASFRGLDFWVTVTKIDPFLCLQCNGRFFYKKLKN